LSFPSELWSVNFQDNHRGLGKAIQLSARYHLFMDKTILPSQSKTFSRAELIWLWGAIIFGSTIRLSFPGRMAIEHFDEGVYASNFWFGPEDDFSYPARYLYAPPLLPAAIEWTMIIASLCGIKPTGFIPIIPCLIAGIAMIPSIWWVCRRWFGAVTGLTSAWLVATSDFHASYSRAALTDVPVCLFILWAVYFIERALAECVPKGVIPNERKPSKPDLGLANMPWRNIVFAGVFTALAWWTKYNGWLPLAIGLAGGMLWQLLTPRNERRILRALGCWLLVATIAIVAWSPVLWGLQKHGGYAAVASNHRKYVVGFNSGQFSYGWLSSGWRQLKNIGRYENALDFMYSPFQSDPHEGGGGPFNTDMFFVLIQNGQWRYLISILQEWAFTSVTPLFVPLGSLVLSATLCLILIFCRPASHLRLPLCLVAAWFFGLTCTTPFYYPYPRLVLPWLCSNWICIALAFQIWLNRSKRDEEKNALSLLSRGFVVVILLMALSSGIRVMSGSAFAWRNRTHVQLVSQQFATSVRKETASLGAPEDEAVVYVLGDPALFFEMKAVGLPAVGPVQGLEFMDRPLMRPTFIAFPSHQNRYPLGSWRFERVDGIPERPSHIVLFDDVDFRPRLETKLFRLIK
jgi:dolichyl-phosphate-mannose-protein mannosyltransferase